MPEPSRTDAQQRADEIRVFGEELARERAARNEETSNSRLFAVDGLH